MSIGTLMSSAGGVTMAAALALAIALALSANAGRAHGQCRYEVTIIEGPECPFTGPAPTVGLDVNESGVVVGYYLRCEDSRSAPFRWSEETGFETLLTNTPAYDARAIAVNDAGVVVGWVTPFENDHGTKHGFILDGTELTLLISPPGGSIVELLDINDQGSVVGWWGNDWDMPGHAFVYENGVLHDLHEQIGGAWSRAFGISSDGKITGVRKPAAGADLVAFTLIDGVREDLGHLAGGFRSEGYAINAHGIVAGRDIVEDAQTGEWLPRAFIHDGERFVIIPPLDGQEQSTTRDINDRSQVVGSSVQLGSTGFLYLKGEQYELNDLIVESGSVIVQTAWSITDEGWIAASGSADGSAVALVLRPVNRPMTDIDGDCLTNLDDLMILIASWGSGVSSADLDSDDNVGFRDLSLLLMNWDTGE